MSTAFEKFIAIWRAQNVEALRRALYGGDDTVLLECGLCSGCLAALGDTTGEGAGCSAPEIQKKI